jgi:hypothetical protein
MLALASAIPKVFERILDEHVRAWSDRVGCLSDLQGGFRAGRGTEDQQFILNEIIAMRAEASSPTFMAFLDIAKAYDRVWLDGLWLKLQRAGLSSQLLELVRLMFRKIVRRVLVNGQTSREFQVHSGVPQGAVLSPLLYANYIDGLHAALRQQGLGIWVYGKLVPLLMYADDLVLLAPNQEVLEKCLLAAERYASQWRFDFNHGKSKVVVVGSRQVRQTARAHVWRLSNSTLDFVESYKYLGIEFVSRRERGKWNTLIARSISKASTSQSLMYRGGGTNGVRPRTMTSLWTSQVRPVLEYGCVLWEGEISDRCEAQLEKVQNSFGRAVLGLKTMASAAGARSNLGLSSLKARRRALKAGYWNKLCLADADGLLSVVFRCRHAEVQAGGAARSCLRSFRKTLSDLDLGQYWTDCSVTDDWGTLVRMASETVYVQEQNTEIAGHTSLAVYSTLDHGSNRGLHPYLDAVGNRLGVRLMTNLRLGTLMLMQRIAAGLKWPTSAGRCLMCRSGCIEDSYHFLVSCPALQQCRQQLMLLLRTQLPQLTARGFFGCVCVVPFEWV